jgi:hypothetical protein
MASFPARIENLFRSVPSIARQVDKLYLILNEFGQAPSNLELPSNVEAIIPKADLKDTGKFSVKTNESDVVLLCDDDIIYPPDYLHVMTERLLRYEPLKPVIGIHGVTYPDFCDGEQAARLVHVFTQSLSQDTFVNQLGTGTVACRGFQMPDFEFMRTSARFVDVRFAVHCEQRGYPRICIAREKGWLSEIKTGPSLFETFTKGWPIDVVREVQVIAGINFLPHDKALREYAQSARENN